MPATALAEPAFETTAVDTDYLDMLLDDVPSPESSSPASRFGEDDNRAWRRQYAIGESSVFDSGRRGQFSNLTLAEYRQLYKDLHPADTRVGDFASASTFAALCALGEAVERAGSLSVPAVASALQSMNLSEFYSTIAFDADGRISSSLAPGISVSQPLPLELCDEAPTCNGVDVPSGRLNNISFPTPRWAYRHCSRSASPGSCRYGGGFCLADGTCECKPGWYGKTCDVECITPFVWNSTDCVYNPSDIVALIASTVGGAVALMLCVAVSLVCLYRSREGRFQRELRRMEAAEHELRSAACTFVFVDADVIRSGAYEALGLSSLPRLQEIEASHATWLRTRRLHSDLALGRHAYSGSILAVSHRWERPDEPDASGVQVRAIREYLRAHEEVELVWYDYW